MDTGDHCCIARRLVTQGSTRLDRPKMEDIKRAQTALDKCYMLTMEAESALNEAMARLSSPAPAKRTPAVAAPKEKAGHSWASRCSLSDSQAIDLVSTWFRVSDHRFASPFSCLLCTHTGIQQMPLLAPDMLPAPDMSLGGQETVADLPPFALNTEGSSERAEWRVVSAAEPANHQRALV